MHPFAQFNVGAQEQTKQAHRRQDGTRASTALHAPMPPCPHAHAPTAMPASAMPCHATPHYLSLVCEATQGPDVEGTCSKIFRSRARGVGRGTWDMRREGGSWVEGPS